MAVIDYILERYGAENHGTLTLYPAEVGELSAAIRALRAERDAAVTALKKINVIRNSVVAHQKVNFSEHIYPLVAALNEAGVEGQPYPEALAYYGPITERCAKAVKERDALAEKVGRMREALQAALATMHEHDNGHCTECGGYPNEHLRDCPLPMLRAALADDGEKK